jgi:hypothetical protein
MHCGYPMRGRELDFGQAEKTPELLGRPAAKDLLAAVRDDPEYRRALWLRHALIHRTTRAPIEVSLGLPGTTGAKVRRPRIELPSEFGGPVGVEELVPQSRDVALRHVSAFAADVDAL